MNRIVVTGIGVVSSLGDTVNQIWSKLIIGKSAVNVLPELYNNLPCRIASEINDITFQDIKDRYLSSSEKKTMSRSSILIMKAAADAMSSAEISENLNKEKLYRYGVSTGIGFDGVDNSLESHLFNNGHLPYSAIGPYALTRGLGNMPSAHLSVRYKLLGPSRSVNTACAAGLHAIGDAYRCIQIGEADLMLAGGVEASITPWAIAAFSRIRALPTKYNDDPNSASRPFDIERSGFVMSEGAGVLILESLSHANERGKQPLAEIVGFGQTGDGYSLVAPDNSGDGAYRAMKAAIESAQVEPHQISYVNAHATSTPQGDYLECKAIERLFGKYPLVSSFKGQLGHCLGGSGAVEAAMTIKCIIEGLIPPNCNLNRPDPKINVSLVSGGDSPVIWSNKPKLVVKNSFGFGGTNCSIVMKEFIE